MPGPAARRNPTETTATTATTLASSGRVCSGTTARRRQRCGNDPPFPARRSSGARQGRGGRATATMATT
eukprot:5241190-Alexandrium_andersonii.AAC.1